MYYDNQRVNEFTSLSPSVTTFNTGRIGFYKTYIFELLSKKLIYVLKYLKKETFV